MKRNGQSYSLVRGWRRLARPPCWLAPAIALCCGATKLAGAPATNGFLAGADCSHLQFFESRGAIYRNKGEPVDALQILKTAGLNCVRLRLFTSSAAQAEADPYNYGNNLADTLPLAIRVKRAGLQFMLDFHYSDTWADPGKQTKPAAWKDLSFPDLEQRLQAYNRECLQAFREAGAAPEYVQIGSEIIGGLLWPDGRVGGAFDRPEQWSQLGRLLQAAIRGVKEGAGTLPPKIIIHIDRGGDWGATQWFYDNLNRQKVDFDIIGQSYYPFWHGTLEALRACLDKSADRYAKPIAIVETAFPWSNSTNVVGLPATPQGQADFVVALTKILKAVPQERGLGIFWWGVEYQAIEWVRTAGFDRRSLFDAGGQSLPAAEALGQSAVPVVLKATPDGDGVRLSWPLSGADLMLAAATNLAPDTSWTIQPNDIETIGWKLSTVVSLKDTPLRFFRLQSE